jgi:hypothetical protein
MAFAAPTMTVRDVPVHATRTLAAARRFREQNRVSGVA